MKLRHIAVFTEDMKKSVEFYQTLGGKAYAEALLDICELPKKNTLYFF